jgi:L-ascorbate metabolism protein UlaG (beta-lactamase superfamily)
LADRITYVGHATVLLELAGLRLVTDPLLRDRFMHVPRHRDVPDPAVGKDIDAVLISHLHADHLDPPSLRMIGRDVPLVVPAGGGATVRRRGFRTVTELAPEASTSVGELTITATPAVHDARSRPVSTSPCCRSPAGAPASAGATSIPSARRRRRRSSGPGSWSRSTGEPSSPTSSCAAGRR